MPEQGDYSRHLDSHVQRSSNQGWYSRCYCPCSVKSEVYQSCPTCLDAFRDLKPASADQKLLRLQDIGWKTPADIPLAPAPTPAAKAPRVATPVVSSPDKRVTRASSSTSDERPPPSPRRQRGRPPNGSRAVPARFRGVRQRKGVPGFLVEIRPPRWKRTIWLGTYRSEREAAGAYDAGIFYTNKKTKYNFPELQGTFPALPPHLRLANAHHSDAIKTFVQHEAHQAALRVTHLPASPERPSSVDVAENSLPPVSSASSSSEESVSGQEMGLNLSADGELYLEPIISHSAYWESWPSIFDCDEGGGFS